MGVRVIGIEEVQQDIVRIARSGLLIILISPSNHFALAQLWSAGLKALLSYVSMLVTLRWECKLVECRRWDRHKNTEIRSAIARRWKIEYTGQAD